MSIVRLETGTATAASPAAEAERVTALRHRAAECLERAYGFLQAGPDPWARLRAEILCGARPAAALGS